jgi:hypothetical protein
MNFATQEKKLVNFSGLHAAEFMQSSGSARPELFVVAAPAKDGGILNSSTT